MARAVGRDHDAVRRVFTFEIERLGSPLDDDRIFDDDGVHEAAASFDLMGIRRVDPFDEHVLRVSGKRRQPPGDAIVMADGDSRQPRRHGTGNVPARRIQMDQIAKRRVSKGTMRIAGNERDACRRSRSGNRPRIGSGRAGGHDGRRQPEKERRGPDTPNRLADDFAEPVEIDG